MFPHGSLDVNNLTLFLFVIRRQVKNHNDEKGTC